jgi:hypothetical protein
MFEIIYIPQMRIHIPHDDDDCLGQPVSFFAVRNGKDVFHHFLNITAVFRQDQSGSAGIIIVFHIKNFNKAIGKIGYGQIYRGICLGRKNGLLVVGYDCCDCLPAGRQVVIVVIACLPAGRL